MIRKIIPLMALFATGFATAQVGIGTKTPASSSQLDIVSDEKGVLFPRVNLVGETDKEPITGDLEESLFVYNLGEKGLTAGFYYWEKDRWVRLLNTQTYVNTTNVSFTLEDDKLTVTDSQGNKVQLDVEEIANNSTFITELTTNEEFINAVTNNNSFITEIINKLKGKYGNVYYHPTRNKFYYINEDGTQSEIDWSELNTTNVSFTLVNDKLIVTDSDENTVELAVSEIANNSTFITELTTNEEFITKVTANETFITEIINKLEGKYGNVYYNTTEKKFYYIKEDGTQGEIDWTDFNTTNESFTLEGDMLTITDSDGNKVELAVSEIANNSTFITELTTNEEFITKVTANETFITEIINKLEGKYGNVYYNTTEKKFYFIKEDGTQGEIDWTDFNTTNESFTLEGDMLTITDSDGNKVELAVSEIANNSTFITELTTNEEFITKVTTNETFITEIINKLEGKYGNVYYNTTEKKFYYIKEDGTQGEIDWTDFNTTNESFTLEGDMLTITDSDGNKVELAVSEIANNSTFITELTTNEEFITKVTANETFITEIINKLEGKYGNVYYNTTEKKFYFIKEDGTQGEIDWTDFNTTNESFTLEGDMLTITDSDGNKVELAVSEIANNSTFITELTTNEEFITKVTANETFITEIINKLEGKYGNVYYNTTEKKFYYIKEDGTQGEIDWTDFNTTNESFTLEGDMLTITDSDGNKVELAVSEIANNSTFITELTTNEEFITKVTANETFITEIINKLEGKYGNVYYNTTEKKFYFIKEDGTQGEIDWTDFNTTNESFTLEGDMLTITDSDGNKVELAVSEIANNSTFITELTTNEEFITKVTANETFITEIINKLEGKYGNVYYNTTEKKFYFIKEDGTQGEIDWTDFNTTNESFTLEGDMLTITDSDGNKVELAVSEIANNSTFITELTTNEEFITKVTANETFITEIINKLEGKYGNVYYNTTEKKFYFIKEDGTQGEIDWTDFNTTNESFTLEGDMLTITDSDGNKVELAVSEIANNSTFITELTTNEEFITKVTANETFITEIINKLEGKYGNVYYNTTEKKFYFIKEDGTQGEIDWTDFNTTNESFTLEGDMLTITDSDGNKVELAVSEIANNSTFITELTTNEEFITKVTANETFITEIINKLEGKYGNVYYNTTEKKFYFIKEDGTQGEIDWTDFNTTNESFTLEGDMLTITDSDGNKVELAVSEIANNSTFITELTTNEEFITKVTANETFITEIINKLEGKYGNVYYNTTEKKFYFIKEDGTQGEIDWTDFNTTNESFTLEGDMLTITDSDGNKVELAVSEIANNSTFITELTTNEEFITKVTANETFITEIINKLEGKYGNVYYNTTEKKFYFIKEDGTQGEIDWTDFNTTNESFTLEGDMLTITDSDGNKVELAVSEIANNSTFITELTTNEEFITKVTANETFITEIINKLEGKYGNVYYNTTEKKFYFIKEDGTQGEIDWTDFNTTNESFTLEGDMLTITDSDGNKVELAVSEIANNSTFITELTTNEEFITKVTANETFITEIINKLEGKYGNVYYNTTEKKFYFIKEDGTQGEIDWTDFNTTNESFTLEGDMLTITDSDGNKVELAVSEIANNSTFITELTTNEEFITKVTANETFITEIINKLEGKFGNVYYNTTEKKFYYIDAEGDHEEIDWSDFNTKNESFTLVNDMLTITDTDGNKVELAVEEIANNSTFITELTTNEEFITNLTDNETLITKIVNKLEGKFGNVYYNTTEKKFYYIDAEGDHEEIDWSDFNTKNESFTLVNDMLTITDTDGNKVELAVEEIANNSTFITELTTNEEFITNLTDNETLITKIVNKLEGKFGNVYYNTTEKKFYYIDAEGDHEEIDWSDFNTTNETFTLVNDMLTITDTDGNKVELAVEEIANNSTFITELTTNEEFITNLTDNETLITKIVNKLEGKFGNVYYNTTEKKFYYIDAEGDHEEIDWSDFNTTNETFTLVNDMLTITDTDGNKVELAVSEIANNSTFITELTTNEEFITNLTDNETLITKIVNKLEGKFGNVYYNTTEKKFYYIDAEGDHEEIDWSDFNTKNESFTLVNDMLTITDTDGNKVELAVEEIANNSTFITELTTNEEFITNLTDNETLITKIVNKLEGKFGNVYYNTTEKKFYYIDAEGDHEEIDWSDFNTTNETFTLVNDMLTITDTDGNKVELAVEEIANNSTFITELTTNEEFITNLTDNETLITKIVNKLEGKFGNVYYNTTEKKFYYIDAEGDHEEIDWSDFNTKNESFTLVNDMLTITDTDGNKVELAVEEIANNSTFITELTTNEEFITNLTDNETLITKIVNKLEGKFGNVYYNTTEKKFYYIDAEGDHEEIDWSDFNTKNESFTLVNDMLTITDTDGNKVELAVEEIANNSTFITELTTNEEFITNLTDNETLITKIVNKLEGKFGNVYYDTTDQKFYYINVEGEKGEIDFSDFNTTNETFTLVGDMLTITDTDGNKVELAVSEIAQNASFVTELTANETFITNMVTKLTGKFGNVYYDTTDQKFYYIKTDGSKEEVDFTDLNTTNESFTLEGTMLTITDSDGNKVQLDATLLATSITLAGDVTGTASATKLTKIQGKPVSAETVSAGEILIFDGTAWKPGMPEIDATKVTAGKELKSDTSITVTDGPGTLLKEASIKVASGGITTTHIKNGTILPEDLDNSPAPNQVLITDTNNIPGWADKSAVSTSPWLIQGSTNVATLNTQNIYQTGAVAIGANTIPASDPTAKLFVAGDVVTTGKFITTNSVYADYVFEKYFTGSSAIKLTYEFNTLKDIAAFVKKNHHLPGVTPIAELNKNENGYGFDLTNLSVELLEKVEELFLHTIEQQDQIEQLRKAQEALNKRLEMVEKMMNNN
ncbi:hypothetical protein ACKUSY_02335 [Myroides odoratus]